MKNEFRPMTPNFVDGRTLAVNLEKPLNNIGLGISEMLKNDRAKQQSMQEQARFDEANKQQAMAMNILQQANGDMSTPYAREAMENLVMASNVLGQDPSKFLNTIGLGAGIKDPTASKTTYYNNGVSVSIMNDGKSRFVQDAQGQLLYGAEAEKALKDGVEAGIQYEGERAATVTTSSEMAKTNAKNREKYLAQGRAAKDMIPKTKQLLSLNKLISTSGFAKNKKRVLDFFGVTDGDEGLFNSKAGELVLDSIRTLGANPTEGERAFLERIKPSIEQGQKVNAAILEDMLDIQMRQVKRAKWLIDNPSKTIDEYFFTQDIEDFSSNNQLDSPSANQNKSSKLVNPTQEQYDAMQVGEKYIYDGVEYVKGE